MLNLELRECGGDITASEQAGSEITMGNKCYEGARAMYKRTDSRISDELWVTQYGVAAYVPQNRSILG